MGMVMQAELYKDGEAKVSQRGQVKSLSGEDKLKDKKVQAQLFPELHYEEMGVETQLKGGQVVRGKPAYVLEVTYPSGQTQTIFFHKKNGLKIQEQVTQETPQGKQTSTTIYENYKKKKGVKFPKTVKIKSAMGVVPLEAKEIKVNTGLSDDLFTLESKSPDKGSPGKGGGN